MTLTSERAVCTHESSECIALRVYSYFILSSRGPMSGNFTIIYGARILIQYYDYVLFKNHLPAEARLFALSSASKRIINTKCQKYFFSHIYSYLVHA